MRYPKASTEQVTAPTSQFRVMGVDVRDGLGNYRIGDFDTVAEALEAATKRAGVGTPVYVYDDEGRLLVRVGSWH